MTATASPANTSQDPGEFASGKAVTVPGMPPDGGDTVGFWVEAYLGAAVRGVRSAEVAGKIARHLGRFRAWFLDGFGHDRVAAVPAREVASWRDHLAATAVRTLADGRVQLMAPATVNNHLAHLSALFTWTADPRRLVSGAPPRDAVACAGLLQAAQAVLAHDDLPAALATVAGNALEGRPSRTFWARSITRYGSTCSERLRLAAEPLTRTFLQIGGPRGTRAPAHHHYPPQP